jgi:hypothetical protein
MEDRFYLETWLVLSQALYLDHACPVLLILKFDRLEHSDGLNSSRLWPRKGQTCSNGGSSISKPWGTKSGCWPLDLVLLFTDTDEAQDPSFGPPWLHTMLPSTSPCQDDLWEQCDICNFWSPLTELTLSTIKIGSQEDKTWVVCFFCG